MYYFDYNKQTPCDVLIAFALTATVMVFVTNILFFQVVPSVGSCNLFMVVNRKVTNLFLTTDESIVYIIYELVNNFLQKLF